MHRCLHQPSRKSVLQSNLLTSSGLYFKILSKQIRAKMIIMILNIGFFYRLVWYPPQAVLWYWKQYTCIILKDGEKCFISIALYQTSISCCPYPLKIFKVCLYRILMILVYEKVLNVIIWVLHNNRKSEQYPLT